MKGKKLYWLSEPAKDAIGYLEEFHGKWSLWNNSPFRQAWLRNFVAYYSPVIATTSWDSSLIFEGVQGELTRFFTPKAKTYIRQLVTIVTKQRQSFQAMAETDGSDVVEDVKLANSLLEQIVANQRLDLKADQLVEMGLVTGAAFTKTIWRTDLGAPFTVSPDGQVIFTGGVEISVSDVFNTFYDITYPHWDLVPWAEVRVVRNRWELVAEHPTLEREILNLPSCYEERGPNTWWDRTLVDEDLVFVYEMYAKPSPALPQGRMLIYSSPTCVYYDDVNIYGAIPIEPNIPEQVMGTTLGYPQFTNILASQEMYDNSLSAIATNQAQFAVQSVAIARGANVNVQELNGMRFVSFTPQNVPGGGKPEPLQLTQSSPETFKFAEMLDGVMQAMSGVNGALRGEPPPGVTSGVAIATLSANALEFVEGISKPYRLCMEKTMLHAVNAYKRFAKLEQGLEIKGRSSQVMRRKFTGENLKNISGVKILTANPLMQTISGRVEVAEKLFSMPQELWPKYVSVLEGRPLTDIYKNDLSQEDLIQSENESLSHGEAVPVLATDDHAQHMQAHAGLLNDPKIRLNGQFNQIILDHILEHYRQTKEVDPYLTAIIRTGKMPMGADPQPQAGAQPQAPGKLDGFLADLGPERAEPARDALNRPVAR